MLHIVNHALPTSKDAGVPSQPSLASFTSPQQRHRSSSGSRTFTSTAARGTRHQRYGLLPHPALGPLHPHTSICLPTCVTLKLRRQARDAQPIKTAELHRTSPHDGRRSAGTTVRRSEVWQTMRESQHIQSHTNASSI